MYVSFVPKIDYIISEMGVFMIAFDLQCKNGHVFEGWFQDRKAYEKQKKKGLVTCPVCDDASISMVPSTFGISKSSQNSPQKIGNDPSKQQLALADLNRKIVNFVEKNFDNVGPDFTKEALKIHYGVTEPRNIRGSSTKEEEKQLKKEGIPIFKVPIPTDPDSDT